MDASEKLRIFQFTPHQATTIPKWMFFQKLFLKSSFYNTVRVWGEINDFLFIFIFKLYLNIKLPMLSILL